MNQFETMEPKLPESRLTADQQAEIERFIASIPETERGKVIEKAGEDREALVLSIWKKERELLPAELTENNEFSPDMAGWEKYLHAVYERQFYFITDRYSFDEWSVKYLYEMCATLENEAFSQAEDIKFGDEPSEDPDLKKCYYERTKKHLGVFSGEIADAQTNGIDPESMLVHTVSGETLLKIIANGFVGSGGIANCAMSQDRIIYSDGYAIIFQAKDLIAAGYPIFKISEDDRDAAVLKEWRTPIAIDVHLARKIVPISEVPDNAKIKNQAQIANTFCGEEYLKNMPRI